jgi:LEA14-like dessication related protein
LIQQLNKQSRFYLLLFFIWSLHGCSSLEQAEQIMSGAKPTVRVKGVKLSDLDLNGMGLVFDMQVENPNPVKILLDHLDYDLKLLGRSFLKGEQSMGLSLAANGSSQVTLPVRMEFDKLLKMYGEINKQDELPYAVNLGLGFDVPLLGRIRMPVNYQGRIPLPKMPDIKLRRVEVEHLTLQKAGLMLELEVANPNQFALMLERLEYRLKLNGIDVGSGALLQSTRIAQQGRGSIQFPIAVNLSEAGSRLYNALIRGSRLRYEFAGSLDAASDHLMIGDVNIPLQKRGQVDLKLGAPD